MSLSTGTLQSATNHHHSQLQTHPHHNHNLHQPQHHSHPHLLIPQPTTNNHNMQLHPPQEELNFSTFMDLCRFCSLKPGQKLSIFEKEAEHRQVLYKVRSVLPSVVSGHLISRKPGAHPHRNIAIIRFQITKDDLLPKKICNRCLAKLEDLIEWRDRAMTTDKVLRNYAESMRVVTSTINFQVNILKGETFRIPIRIFCPPKTNRTGIRGNLCACVSVGNWKDTQGTTGWNIIESFLVAVRRGRPFIIIVTHGA